MSDSPTSPFGFKDVDAREKVSLVHGVFARVASKYDLMNDLMSGGVHHVWKDAACARLGVARVEAQRVVEHEGAHCFPSPSPLRGEGVGVRGESFDF